MGPTNPQSAPPREVHHSHAPDSTEKKSSYRPGAVVGNKGLSFAGRRGMAEGPNESVLETFKQIMMYVKHGTAFQARYALNKLALIGEQLEEREMWHALSTLSELALNRDADSSVRVGAIEMMEWLYPRVIERKMERVEKGKARGAGEGEKSLQPKLPPVNVKAVLEAYSENMADCGQTCTVEELKAEEDMARAILVLTCTSSSDDEKEVLGAAERAMISIDSPVMRKMLNTLELTEGGERVSSPYLSLDEPDVAPCGERLEDLDISLTFWRTSR